MAYNPVNSSSTLADSVSDLNDAFDLLLGLSHSSSAPSSPEAWQPWLDSTSSAETLKIRNGANSAWLSVFSLGSTTGPIASDGSDTIKILAPSGLSASYTLTLPNSTELPSSGHRYVLVDSSGNLTFSATGP